MKLPSNDDVDQFSKSITFGFLKGAALGGVASGIATLIIRRRYPTFFATAGGFQRNLVFVSPAILFGVTNMELASSSFEEQKRDPSIKPDVPTGPVQVSFVDRAKSFISENQYKMIVGGWAASIAGSFYLVNRDKYMTRSQKIVQARVYAQGATVAMLLLSVLLSVEFGESKSQKRKEAKEANELSWERDLKFVSEGRVTQKDVERTEHEIAEKAQAEKQSKSNPQEEQSKGDVQEKQPPKPQEKTPEKPQTAPEKPAEAAEKQ